MEKDNQTQTLNPTQSHSQSQSNLKVYDRYNFVLEDDVFLLKYYQNIIKETGQYYITSDKWAYLESMIQRNTKKLRGRLCRYLKPLPQSDLDLIFELVKIKPKFEMMFERLEKEDGRLKGYVIKGF